MARLYCSDAAGLVRPLGDRFEPAAPATARGDPVARRASLASHGPWRDGNADAQLHIGCPEASPTKGLEEGGARLRLGIWLLGTRGVARWPRAAPQPAGVRAKRLLRLESARGLRAP